MKCINKRTGEQIAQQVELANTFWGRLKGLMFRKALPAQTALLLDPCPQIHTCFMRFSIDVIFLDENNKVVGVIETMKPWRMSKWYFGSKRTLELPTGSLKASVKEGDELIFN